MSTGVWPLANGTKRHLNCCGVEELVTQQRGGEEAETLYRMGRGWLDGPGGKPIKRLAEVEAVVSGAVSAEREADR
jgi:hypothetical protein